MQNMVRFRFVDCTLLFVFIVFIYTVTFSGSPSGEAQNEEANGQRAPNYLYEDIREMCQFLEHETRGDEGDQWLNGNEYETKLKLRGISLAFRHGERSPLIEVEDPTGCLPQRDVDRKNFQKYKELALSEDVIEFLKVDPAISDFPRVPDDSKCTSGLLTAEGALQHVKLGKFLRERYAKSKLFMEESQRVVTEVTTSKFPRTLQSLLAFASEFLFKKRQFLTPIQIKASDDTFQCTDKFCDCKLAKKMRHMYEKEHAEFFDRLLHLPNNKKLADEVSRIRASISDFSNVDDPFRFIDVALGKFVCRRKKLPCHDENCVDYGFLNEMINISTWRGREMFEMDSGISRKLQVLEAWPVLSYVREAIVKIRKFSHTNYIRIFSGHDVLIAPILRVLGVPFVDPPHYTARVVFEIYEHADEGIFIRIMYNGYNRSFDVKFCKGDDLKFGMCRASAFEKFLKPENYFGQLGVFSFQEACAI